MRAIEIDALRVESSRLSAVVRAPSYAGEIFFGTSHSPIASSADPFVPAALLLAMGSRCDLEIRAPVSQEILRAAAHVQEVEWAWHRDWRIAKVSAASSRDDVRTVNGPGTPPAGAVGAFFSGGVDSFYTLQKHRQEITHLVFVSGFDIPLRRSALRQLVVRELRDAANEIGLPLIEVETNLRELSDGLAFSWEEQHGAALAAVAHFLAPGFRKIYVPSSYGLAFLFPYGSHPGLDPLWGSASLELPHDGIEATRFAKIGAISSWQVALRRLRVCWELPEDHYNCCRCGKCLWTMAFLRAHGALGNASSFPLPLDLRRLAEHPPKNTDHRHRFIQAIAMVERRGDDPELAQALRAAFGKKFALKGSLTHTARRARASLYRQARSAVRAYRRVRRHET